MTLLFFFGGDFSTFWSSDIVIFNFLEFAKIARRVELPGLRQRLVEAGRNDGVELRIVALEVGPAGLQKVDCGNLPARQASLQLVGRSGCEVAVAHQVTPHAASELPAGLDDTRRP